MRLLLGVLSSFFILTSSSANAQIPTWDDHFAVKRAYHVIRDVAVTDTSLIMAGDVSVVGKQNVRGVAELMFKTQEWSDFGKAIQANNGTSVTDLVRDSVGSLYFFRVQGRTAADMGFYKLSNGTLTKLPPVRIGSKRNGKMAIVAGRNTVFCWSDEAAVYQLENNEWKLLAQFCIVINDTCLPTSSMAYPIKDVLPVGDSLFVLSDCNRLNGEATTALSLYNGKSWSSFSGLDPAKGFGLNTLAYNAGTLYVTGTTLDSIGSVPVKWVASFDGTSWRSMNSTSESEYQLAYPPTSFAFVHGKVYALGRFVDKTGKIYADVASWDGKDWVPKFHLYADRIFGVHGELYAHDRNEVWHVTGQTVNVAGFNDQSKYLGLSGSVFSFANHNGALWATGFLTQKSLDSFEQLAYLDDNGMWKQGIGAFVNHAEQYNKLSSGYGRLYFAGRFPDYKGMNCNSILQWNGNDWEQLGSGFKSSTEEENLGSIEGLLVTKNGVIASGIFDTAGGTYARYLARWDGTQWHPFNNEQSVVTNAMLEYNDTLIVGNAADLDPVQVYRLAYWNGSRFAPWPSLPNNKVTSIQKFGQGFVIGGYFDSVGSLPVRGVAYWDGTKWSAFDTSVPPYINAIKVNGDELLVAGREVFSKWNGSKWTPMVSDLKNKEIYALEITGNKLYVGGYFRSLDGVPSMHIGSTTIQLKSDVNPVPRAFVGFSLFPNPATSVVKIQGGLSPRSVKVLNLLGQAVLEITNLHTSEIDVSALESGRYFIYIVATDGTRSLSPLQILR